MLVYLTAAGPYSSLAKRIAAADGEWVTSTLWRSEFLNVMAGQIRRGNLTLESAIDSFLGAAEFIVLERIPQAEGVLRLVATSNCTAYDLEFVVVAQTLGVPLVTNDKQILADFPSVAISPGAFAA